MGDGSTVDMTRDDIRRDVVEGSEAAAKKSKIPALDANEYDYLVDMFCSPMEVSSSNFGRGDRDLNTGLPLGTDAEGVSAVNSVYHDRAHPSRLVLPVVGDGVAVFSP
jgi:hypothetical protein